MFVIIFPFLSIFAVFRLCAPTLSPQKIVSLFRIQFTGEQDKLPPMVKFMIMFHKPVDLEAFEDSYNTFLALIERIPNIRRRQVISVLGSPLGETRLYRILEAYFDDYPSMQAALLSPAGQEAGGDLGKFMGAFEMLFADVFEETGGSTPNTDV
jgi:uncharacterized protein (TIGR02118 family)